MSFELRHDEPVRKGIRRIVRKQLNNILEQVGGRSNQSRDNALHDARKSFKRVRSVLRMVRPVIDEAIYRTENARFRDASRPLSEVRDAKILIESLDNLIEHFSDTIRGKPFDAVRHELKTHHREIRRRVLDEEHAFAVVEAAVRDALDQLNDWTKVPNSWRSIGLGVKKTYKQARRACSIATVDSTPENRHEWRKQAKYLRYQLEILCPTWPELMSELAGQVKKLGDLLGDDHDLAVLRDTLMREPDRFGGGEVTETLTALVDRRREELFDEAKVLGERLFQDQPRDFARRLKGYWRAWRKQTQALVSA